MSTNLLSKCLKSKGPQSNYMYCLKIDMTKGPLSKPKNVCMVDHHIGKNCDL